LVVVDSVGVSSLISGSTGLCSSEAFSIGSGVTGSSGFSGVNSGQLVLISSFY